MSLLSIDERFILIVCELKKIIIINDYQFMRANIFFSCPFLHRTAGDTERRYHLRYYKTGTCVYETDTKGNCTKNGPHCAFAHGAHDMRPPVYDSTEMQPSMDIIDKSSTSPSTLEKDKVLAEDPRWNGKLSN